jgi:hypothetical protein
MFTKSVNRTKIREFEVYTSKKKDKIHLLKKVTSKML